MPSKTFLKLDGVPGDSKAPRHFGEIEISGWSWGGNQFQQTLAIGAAQGKLAKSMKSDLTVTKQPDRASQILIEAVVSGRTFAKAVLTIENVSASGSLLRSIITRLKTVAVTSAASSANSETVTFSFETVEIVYPETAG